MMRGENSSTPSSWRANVKREAFTKRVENRSADVTVDDAQGSRALRQELDWFPSSKA